ALQRAAAGKRNRQLREGRAAHPREDRARSRAGSGASAEARDVGGANGVYEIATTEVTVDKRRPRQSCVVLENCALRSYPCPLLVAFRIMQGATGGCLQPLSQAVLLEAFPPQDRGKAMGFWALGIVVAPILGPVLGGWLTDNYSWRWVFYINIPVGIASIVMTKLYIFDPPYLRQEMRRVDYWGIGMLVVGIGALQIVLDKGQEEDWFSSRMIT